MKAVQRKNATRERRKRRVRRRIVGTSERPRLSVSRTLKHIYCQVIDDVDGRTLLAVSSVSAEVKSEVSYGGNIKAAVVVGRQLAQKALQQGIKKVAFDRGPYKYHGRVKALADSCREQGLQF